MEQAVTQLIGGIALHTGRSRVRLPFCHWNFSLT